MVTFLQKKVHSFRRVLSVIFVIVTVASVSNGGIVPLSTIIPGFDTRLCSAFDVQPRRVVTGVCLSSHECAYILND